MPVAWLAASHNESHDCMPGAVHGQAQLSGGTKGEAVFLNCLVVH